MNQPRRVVITGIGVVSPIGNDVVSAWQGVLEGRSGVGPITQFDASAFATKIAAEVKGFEVGKYLDPKEAKKHDLYSQYAMGAATQAWEDAGLREGAYSANRMGCILGVGMGGLGTLEEMHEIYLKDGPRRISPFLIPKMISNIAPGYMGIRFGLKGVNFTITSACASSTHAIGESYRMIQNGVQDLMVTGGSESTVTPMGIGGFCSLRALSTRNDEPQKASRPFDKDRDGFVLGEGAAIFVMESLDSAQRRGARIYAEVKGYGASCDGYHITAPCVDGEGAVNCMRLALQDAKLESSQINYVNAHGTSTDANDNTETLAIKTVFGDWAKNGLLVSSTKSMTGHLLGAAGAIEALFCVLALKENVVPPTINLDNPGEGLDLDYVPHKPRKANLVHTMSNSFGFGGTNATLIISQL